MLSFKDCGYFLNDHFLECVIKSCKLIEILNLANCKDLTDRSLYSMSTCLPNLRQLDISGNKRFTQDAVVNLCEKCTFLADLEVDQNVLAKEIFNDKIRENAKNKLNTLHGVLSN